MNKNKAIVYSHLLGEDGRVLSTSGRVFSVSFTNEKNDDAESNLTLLSNVPESLSDDDKE